MEDATQSRYSFSHAGQPVSLFWLGGVLAVVGDTDA